MSFDHSEEEYQQLLWKYESLLRVIKKVHSQRGDDLCWMDIDLIFVAAGLPVPRRQVGDKEAMKANCVRFIDTMCAGGDWPSYADLEEQLAQARTDLAVKDQCIRSLAQGRAVAAEVIAKFAGRRLGSCCVECGSPLDNGRICNVCLEVITRGPRYSCGCLVQRVRKIQAFCDTHCMPIAR
jgi:hypothetical protein